MTKNIIAVLLFVSSITIGQNSIKGTLNLENKTSDRAILYKLEGAKQLYIVNTKITDSIFNMEIPADTKAGMFRLKYSLDPYGFVDFLYNNENISFKLDEKDKEHPLLFVSSKENILYQDYLEKSFELQSRLNAAQIQFFGLKEKEQQELASVNYLKLRNDYEQLQTDFENKSTGMLANHFIKASRKYFEPTLLETPQAYLNNLKQHYFDFVNFEDDALLEATFLNEKVIAYVFYLNNSEDEEVQMALYKNALNEVMLKIVDNNKVKSEILTSLLYTFEQLENMSLLNYVLENLYNKLPEIYRDETLVNELNTKIKLAIGNKAPEITWEEKGVQKKLSELHNANHYVLVFWSSTCSHCLNEIPKLYEYFKEKNDIQVMAVALENNANSFKTYQEKYKGWIHILGLNKWENEFAKLYEINATPTYFVLDSDKRFVSKPTHFENVKEFFEN